LAAVRVKLNTSSRKKSSDVPKPNAGFVLDSNKLNVGDFFIGAPVMNALQGLPAMLAYSSLISFNVSL
jgi:hypothetical protein